MARVVIEKSLQSALQEFGIRLRRARDAAGLTQEALAARAGRSVTYVSDIERGRKNVPFETMWRLANALELPLGDLFRDVHVGAPVARERPKPEDDYVALTAPIARDLARLSPRDRRDTLRAFRILLRRMRH